MQAISEFNPKGYFIKFQYKIVHSKKNNKIILRKIMIMKYLKIFVITTLLHILVYSHCQIPCGIYSDAAQIMQIYEDLETIHKAMKKINELSTKSDAQTLNQINRWIMIKEQHANNIQNITSDYFLTQRIKIDVQDYSTKVMLLHKILILAMKCKQTVDKQNISYLESHLENFSKIYLDEHGFKHLNDLMK